MDWTSMKHFVHAELHLDECSPNSWLCKYVRLEIWATKTCCYEIQRAKVHFSLFSESNRKIAQTSTPIRTNDQTLAPFGLQAICDWRLSVCHRQCAVVDGPQDVAAAQTAFNTSGNEPLLLCICVLIYLAHNHLQNRETRSMWLKSRSHYTPVYHLTTCMFMFQDLSSKNVFTHLTSYFDSISTTNWTSDNYENRRLTGDKEVKK